MSMGGQKTASTLLCKWSLGEMKSPVVYMGPFRYPEGFGSALSCPEMGPVPISFDHVLPFSGKRNQQFLQYLCTENISVCTGQHLRKLIPLHRGWTLLLTCWKADTKLLFLQLHFEAAWDGKKKKGGLFRSANVSLYELTLAQAGTEGPEEMSYTFLGSCRLFMTGYWHNVAEENLCQTCQRVQWTCGRDLDPWGRPGDTEEARARASTWLNLSSINLWVVSAAGCVTHSSSLLWSVLICYWLNTLRYFMYLSASSFRADLYHPSQELEQEAKEGFWICGKCIFRLFSTSLLLESLLPELAGHISAVWLRVPAAALDLPAAECFHSG